MYSVKPKLKSELVSTFIRQTLAMVVESYRTLGPALLRLALPKVIVPSAMHTCSVSQIMLSI